jgi:hypothetical protein
MGETRGNRSTISVLVMAATSMMFLRPLAGAGPSFRPDFRFAGSTLAEWHALGDAECRVEDGRIVGTPRQSGGWLLLDRSYRTKP